MLDIKQITHDLEQVVIEANPWKESPPVSCSVPYSLLCDVLSLLKEHAEWIPVDKRLHECCTSAYERGEQNALKEQEGIIKTLKDKNAKLMLKEQAEWIPVGERLPDNNEDILAYCVHGEESCIVPANYYNGEFYNCIFNAVMRCEITHWMPLPKPPKEEGGQNA